MKFPDRTTAIGRIINDFLQNKYTLSDETVQLLFAANRREKLHLIKNYLQSGYILY